ncbi:alpha/beta hydrolase family protein [Halioxenophilus sp. WMMB6]|uniref:alpha/beta hydrolase family protein n=1 Tax=Halioxenophilus sp. WMMB6 TaxID=3073815 RepID=UPI00295E60E6|nr:alpha/beta fold hydrolase [Halioxenophilus sp. WMMB6]
MPISLFSRLLSGLLLLGALMTAACTVQPAGEATAAVTLEPPAVNELDVGERTMQVWSWPAAGEARGVILFSHGAASAPWKYDPLIHRWQAAGYTVYAPLHVDSTDHPLTAQYPGMASWQARLEDMAVLADAYGANGYVAAGHSYGGLVALTLGGADAILPEGFKGDPADSRVSLVLAFSPPPAIPGLVATDGYAALAVPALIQTGTQDVPFGSDAGWRVHLDAYEAAAPGGDRYALVLDGVDHYFGGAICRPELPGPKLLAEIATAADISLLMLRAYQQQDASALAALDGRLSAESPTVLLKK